MVGFDEFLTSLRAAAEPTRLRLLVLCASGELTVTELTQILGQSQPRVSRHLKLLVDAGLLERFREGTWAFYRLARETDRAKLARKIVDMLPMDDLAFTRDMERFSDIQQDRAKEAQAYFSKNAAQWDALRKLHADDSMVDAAVLKVLGDAPIGSFLDIGTGTGCMLELLGPRAKDGLGIDFSSDMLNVARANLERAKLVNCQVRHGDMYGLSADGRQFDLVTIHQVLHYADQPGVVIAEASRVLKPGGSLVIIDFAPHSEETLRIDHAHRRLGFKDDEVSDWCVAAGLEPQAPVSLAGEPLTVKIWLSQKAAGAGS
ncbi:MAG: metalloregulator ArsR/SmtB family transcription factor [Rhodospirillales bacterium]|nr:metalloregulator ArsR/SmtB family transcription factor [Rhodospirillales bacterium]MBT4006830.1 metalloregulator ArsR/SmtB family transcription factor [Rhodospirillales bacterium]MBT5076357.1 metalloregulator ArsR/SmtB family transcription factor [Rhodospirillales bacterium]MBT5113143.1 metalloregulator ArsR/SmtB family transcription factor [Rhodospirillales bacterium]MBT5673019.1 metalloregulator ArsR/SmtB family transcription factor [Rhodospirillales bacterium]